MGIVGKNVVKQFGSPPMVILHGLDLEIEDGEFVSISGRSGSGKSTLLYLLSTLDNPSDGVIEIDGVSPQKMTVNELHRFRNEKIGFIFQFHYLLPELTGLENVLLGPRNLGLEKQKKDEALALLDQLEVYKQANKFPSEMSGGEQQRVAIARALILSPKYLFADEPTGNLDSVSGNKVMSILEETSQNNNMTIVLVTHERDYAARANREIYLVDGRISENYS